MKYVPFYKNTIIITVKRVKNRVTFIISVRLQ